jgi:hypothetical protein
MKLLCINDLNPQPNLFHGKWIKSGETYSGHTRWMQCAGERVVIVRGIPGKRMRKLYCKCGKCNYGFATFRFVRIDKTSEYSESNMALVASNVRDHRADAQEKP